MIDSAWGLSWHYNWGTDPISWSYPTQIKFAPQFWGRQDVDFVPLDLDGDFIPLESNKILLIIMGFN